MRAASTVDGGDAQRRAITSLFTRFTADRDQLASAIRRCEERLDALAHGEPPRLNGAAAPDEERFRQLEQSVLEATREARHAIEVARQSLDGATALDGTQRSLEALRGALAALEQRVGAPAAAAPIVDDQMIASLERRVKELGVRLDALASLEHRMMQMENEADARLQTAVAHIGETMADLEERVTRALAQSGRALDRAAELLSTPAVPGDAPNLGWMREELDARIEATNVAVKDTRAHLAAKLADLTQRGDDVLGRLGELASRQDAIELTFTTVEARMADVGERLRQLGERLNQVAAIAAQDTQQPVLARLHARLDVVEAGLRRVEPAPAWSVQETVARALEPVMPAFIAGWLRPERR